MTNTNIASILQDADQAALSEDWEQVSALLKSVLDEDPKHSDALTGMGITKIHQEDLQAAVNHFQQVVKLKPNSAEAYNNLGVAYSLQTNWDQAEAAYQHALDLRPEDLQAWKNLADVYLQQSDRLLEGVQILAAVIKKNPRDKEALSMMANCYEEINDLNSAAFLYEEILELDPENLHAKDRLKLVGSRRSETNQIARPEHAAKLAALKNLTGGNGKAHRAERRKTESAAFFGPNTFAFKRRMNTPARGLAAAGWDIKLSTELTDQDLDRYQVMIFSRPHQSPDLMNNLRRAIQSDQNVIIDLDADFAQIPETHPEYELLGPGSPESLERLEEVLDLGCNFSFPGAELVEKYQDRIENWMVIPTGWHREDSTWDAPTPERSTFNLGLISTHLHLKICPEFQEQITKAVVEIPEALLVAAGDHQLLAEFSDLPEDKKMFIPLGSLENYPYTYTHFDLLLVPGSKHSFYQSQSDLAVLEAGIRKIPWLADPRPSFKNWDVGGVLIENQEWYSAVMDLYQNPQKRIRLGSKGYEKAKQRDSYLIQQLWRSYIKEIKE